MSCSIRSCDLGCVPFLQAPRFKTVASFHCITILNFHCSCSTPGDLSDDDWLDLTWLDRNLLPFSMSENTASSSSDHSFRQSIPSLRVTAMNGDLCVGGNRFSGLLFAKMQHTSIAYRHNECHLLTFRPRLLVRLMLGHLDNRIFLEQSHYHVRGFNESKVF